MKKENEETIKTKWKHGLILFCWYSDSKPKQWNRIIQNCHFKEVKKIEAKRIVDLNRCWQVIPLHDFVEHNQNPKFKNIQNPLNWSLKFASRDFDILGGYGKTST